MNNDSWSLKKLGEVVQEIADGGTPQRAVSENFGGDIPWVVVDDIRWSIYDTKEKLSQQGISTSSTKMWQPGTIILSTGATIGRVGIARVPLCTKQGIHGIVCDPEVVTPEYIAHFLRHCHHKLNTLAQGSTIKEIRAKQILSLDIPTPPLPEQKKIAEILSGIDNLIASAKKQEAKNKDLALGVAESILTSNCERRRLGDATTLITKGTTPTSLGMSFSEQGINFIKVESITSDGTIDPSKFSFIQTDVHDALQRSQIKSKDILFTIAGATVGKLAMAEEHHLPANTNQALAIIRVKNEMLRPRFAYHWLKSGTIRTIVDQLQTVGAQPNVSLSQISDFPVPIIALDSQDYICDKLDSIDRVTNSIREKIFTMQRLHQSLSADLLSGRKRVSV